MSKIKVSEMPPAGTLTGAEIFPIVQDGANKNAELADIRSLISVTGDLTYDSATGVISLTAAGVSQGDNISLLTNDAGYLTSEANDLTSAVTWANVPDVNITQTSVTQHESALSITESQITDLQNYLTSETTTGISFDNSTNTLSYTDENSTTTDIDLSLYLDDTNLARLTSGTVDGSGVATFTRDDATTFTVDFSSLFDDTNLARITSAGFNSTNGTLTLTRDDASTVTADLDGRYLTDYSVTESDVTQHESALSITESQITDFQNYLTDYTVTESDVTQHEAALSITESQITDLQNYLTDYTVTESDVTQHEAALSITESQITDLSGGDPTKATLTKTFTENEIAVITLSGAIATAPSVNVIKEVPQTGQLSKGRWDVASDGANYDRQDTAYDTDLSISQISEVTIAGASYDSVDVNLGNISPNFFTPYRGLAFDDTGNNMFVLDNDFRFEQYSLSSPYAINTANFVSEYQPFNDLNFTEPSEGLVFNNTGTSLFSIDISNFAVQKYNLGTAYDLSSNQGEAAQSYSIPFESVDLKFNDTGTKLYIAENANPYRISQFSLGTAFDLTTVTADSVTFGTPSDTNEVLRAFQFNSTGDKLFVLYWNDFDFVSIIREAELSTPYDLSTASFTSNELTDTGENFEEPRDLEFNNNRSKLFILGLEFQTGNNSVLQYSMGLSQINLLSLGTGSFAATDVGKQIEGNSGVVTLTADDGSFQEVEPFADTSTILAGEWAMFATEFDPSLGVTVTGISEAGSITNAAYDDVNLSYNSDLFGSLAQSFIFNDTGTKLYLRERSFLYDYDLSQPYDLSSATFNSEFPSGGTFFDDFEDSVMEWNADGTRFYITDDQTIYQFNVPTAFDLSSVDFGTDDGNFNPSFTGTIKFIEFNADGTKIFLADSSTLSEYALSSAFDITSFVDDSFPDASFDFNNLNFETQGGTFSLAGDRVFVIGYDINTDEWSIREYAMSSFDVSTLSSTGNSYTDSRFETSSTSARLKIRLENDDQKLFLLENDSNFLLYQYTANIFNFIQPTGAYHPVVTNSGGQIDTTTWLDINSMSADEALGDGEVVYAVSTDNRTSWKVINDTDGERTIARLNASTWEYNSATNYSSEAFTAATENQELYALQEALEATIVNRMDSTQLEAVTDPNHYTLANNLDLMIALKISSGTVNTPSSDGVAIGYDAETLNKGAVHGVDYDYDLPDSTTLRLESLIAANLKIRIL